MNEYIWISEWIAYPTQTGKCGFDLILPLLKKPAHFLWLWSATFFLNCPASSQQLPEAHFLPFEHLISLSKYSSAFSFGEYACLPASSSSSPHLWHGVGLADLLGQFSSVQSLSRVQLFATPWTAARQASLSITNSRSLNSLSNMGNSTNIL